MENLIEVLIHFGRPAHPNLREVGDIVVQIGGHKPLVPSSGRRAYGVLGNSVVILKHIQIHLLAYHLKPLAEIVGDDILFVLEGDIEDEFELLEVYLLLFL